jgi:hypothetical protein
MSDWNPWKVTAITMFVVLALAMVAGMVVAGWSGPKPEERNEAQAPRPVAASRPASSARSAPVVAQAPAVVPPQAAVEACNRYAAQQVPQDKTKEVLTDGALGAVAGAAIGAAGGAIAGGGKGAGKGAAIGGIVGATGGALYGLNENRKNDERYRAAYAACMRGRGYGG